MTKTKPQTAADEISIGEAMELLNVSKPTIYAHIRKWNLHPIKKALGVGVGGRRVFLSRREVESLRTASAAPRLDAGLGDAGLTRRPSKTAKRGGK